MKFILNDVDPNNAGYILAVRAAASVAKVSLEVGSVRFIEYENGETYAVTVGKQSVTVWPSAVTARNEEESQ